MERGDEADENRDEQHEASANGPPYAVNLTRANMLPTVRGTMVGVQQRRARPLGRVLVATAVAMSLSLSPPVARAQAAPQDPIAQRVEKLAADAAVAYHGADYAKAVDLLEQAYRLRQMGVILYNTAKAYDKLGDQEKAVELYRRYSASSDADVSLRARADARIAAYEDTHQRQRIPPTHRPLEVVRPPPVETPEQRTLRLWVERRRFGRRLGIGFVSTGLVCAFTAVGLSATAYAQHSNFENSTGEADPRRSARDRARAFAISADVLYGVAAVSAAVGAYFLWRGYHPEGAPGSARISSVAPWVTPREGVAAGLSVEGMF